MAKKQQKPFLESKFFEDEYEPDDKVFLRSFLADYPNIRERFNKYEAMDASERLNAAAEDLHTNTPRASWDAMMLPHPRQSVGEHTDGMVRVAEEIRDLLQKKQPDLRSAAYRLDETPSEFVQIFTDEAQFNRLCEMIKLHDIAEAIVTDIPNHRNDDDGDINRSDKIKVEHCAATLLFYAHPEKRALYDEYERKETLMANIAKATDIIEFMRACVSSEESINPSNNVKNDKGEVVDRAALLAEYWDTSKERLVEAFKDQAATNGKVPQIFQRMAEEAHGRHHTNQVLY